jgi:hypothetical protein
VKLSSPAPGGIGETQCARDGAVQPDGSIAGADLTPLLGLSVQLREITRTGHWVCVGRFRAAHGDSPDGEHYTRWSAPVSFDTVTRFSAERTVPDRRPPRYTVAYRVPPGSEGGIVKLRITRAKGCPRVRAKTMRATIGPSLVVRFTFKLPEKNKARLTKPGIDSYGWQFRLDFSGTKQVRPAFAIEGAFVSPKRFAQGHTLGFPGLERAYCTRTA